MYVNLKLSVMRFKKLIKHFAIPQSRVPVDKIGRPLVRTIATAGPCTIVSSAITHRQSIPLHHFSHAVSKPCALFVNEVGRSA